MGIQRWTFEDLNKGDSYTFHANPNAGGSAMPEKSLSIEVTYSPEINGILQLAPWGEQVIPFSGAVHTQEQDEAMEAWALRQTKIRLTDDLGRSFVGILSGFSRTRIRRATNPWYSEYDAQFHVVGEVEPISMPGPWAWYRSDDLDTFYSDQDTVTSWTDRTGGGRDLILAGSSSWEPQYLANALDGFGAIRHPNEANFPTGAIKALQADYDPYPFTNGLTVVQVQLDRWGSNAQNLLGFGISAGPEIFLNSYDGDWNPAPPHVNTDYEFVSSGLSGMAGNDASAQVGGNDWAALLGTMGSDVTRLFANGHELTPNIYLDTSGQSEWDSVTSQWLLMSPRGQMVRQVEYIIWDWQLDVSERAAVWTYLADRYPSLVMV